MDHRKNVQGAGGSHGAIFYPVPETIDPGEMDLYDFYPELKKLHGAAQLRWYIKHAFVGTVPEQIKAIDAALNQFGADVLVGDLVMLGVFYKSQLSEIPSALILPNPLAMPSPDTAPFGLALLPGRGALTEARNRLLNWFTDYVFMRDVNVHQNRIRAQLGLPPRRTPISVEVYEFPALAMEFTTPAFEYPRRNQPPNLHFIGPMLPKPDPAYTPPTWWPDLQGNAPVVMVTEGTTTTTRQDLILSTIDALSHENVLIVAVPFDKQTLPSMPKNVRAEKFIPFEQLLPHVDVLVTNGRYGGVQQALAKGVPLVVAGTTEDHMEVAARVEWSGAGINLRKQRPSPSQNGAAVKQVLENRKFIENARRIRNDFAKYDAPKRAAELLEALAQHRGEMALTHPDRRQIA